MRFDGVKVLVLGELLLDRYYHVGKVRDSQEVEGLPIAEVASIRDQLGGAGGVATIARQIGAQVTLWCPCGMSAESIRAVSLIRNEIDERWQPRGMADVSVKHRFLVDGKQAFCRFDLDCREVRSFATGDVHGYGAVLIADYGKGVCSPDVLHEIIAYARLSKVPVLVDPARGVSWERYAGATLIKCNADEAAAQGDCLPGYVPNVIVTQGASGMDLHDPEGVEHIDAEPCEVLDVTGAGDAVLAAIGCAVASGASLPDACRFAATIAARCCGQLGARV